MAFVWTVTAERKTATAGKSATCNQGYARLTLLHKTAICCQCTVRAIKFEVIAVKPAGKRRALTYTSQFASRTSPNFVVHFKNALFKLKS